jgi:inosine-uridine nucleoside N-ribohydrolase
VTADEANERDLIVDTDTLGINDDALALYYLFALGRVPRLITTVFGNASAASSAQHAHALACAHTLDIDVVRGSEKPLWWDEPVREEVRAVVAALPEATYVAALSPGNKHFWETAVEDGPAPEALAEVLRRSSGSDILAIGPITNIARALELLDPSVPNRHCLWISGGSISGGNVTEDAEFNVFADPEALQRCLSADWKSVVMAPLEVLGLPRLVPAVVDRIRRTSTPLGAALDRLERESPRGDSKEREPMWDVVAASVMADRGLHGVEETGVLSVFTDLPHRGGISFRQGTGTHRLVTEIDPDAMVQGFEAVVSRLRMSP